MHISLMKGPTVFASAYAAAKLGTYEEAKALYKLVPGEQRAKCIARAREAKQQKPKQQEPEQQAPEGGASSKKRKRG